jgi:hypothetical protein
MTDVAAAINEFKRRKDLGETILNILFTVHASHLLSFLLSLLVMRYKKDRESSLSDRFAKLNVHSTMKKFYRLSQKVVGIHVS